MPSAKDVRIYIAIRKSQERSRMEDRLVLDGYDVSSFRDANELWEQFQVKPARMVITDRRFGSSFDGLELARAIRKDYMLPYVYIVVLSVMDTIKNIQEGLAAGVDDYLIKPPNPFQVRTRVLIGARWLTYIDSLHEPRKPPAP
jgi:DNA-binding response OmpR family regulator